MSIDTKMKKKVHSNLTGNQFNCNQIQNMKHSIFYRKKINANGKPILKQKTQVIFVCRTK